MGDDVFEDDLYGFTTSQTQAALGVFSLNDTSRNNESDFSDKSDSAFVIKFIKVVTFLDNYFLLMIIIVGLIGNTLSFLVFVCTYLNRLSSSVYLAALALADAGFLFCLLVSWSNNIGIHWYNTRGWCPLFVYLTYICSFLSVWYVVCFTIERYVAVCLPLRRQNMCTPRRAKIVVISLAVLGMVLYNFALWTSRVQNVYFGQPYCFPLRRFTRLINYANNIDTVLTLAVPSITIVIANVRIVYVIIMVQRSRCQSERDEKSNDSSGVTSRFIPRSNCSSAQNSQIRVTKMLITVSSIFLLLNMPSHLIRLYAFIMSIASESFKPSKLFALTQRLFLYVYYMNFAINFFLYSICGRNFRCAMKHLGKTISYYICKACSVKFNQQSEDVPIFYRAHASLSSPRRKRKGTKMRAAKVVINLESIKIEVHKDSCCNSDDCYENRCDISDQEVL